MATQPPPYWGPHHGKVSKWLHNPCLLAIPTMGRCQYGYITPAFSGSPPRGGVNTVAKPLPSWGPRNGEETTSLYNRCLRGVPTMGDSQYGDTAPVFLGSPQWGGDNIAI